MRISEPVPCPRAGRGGSGYAAGEAGRIERILGSKITAEAKADLQRRLNVLQAFRTTPSPPIPSAGVPVS